MVNTYSFIDLELKLASRFVLSSAVVDAGGVFNPVIDTDKWTRATVVSQLSRAAQGRRGKDEDRSQQGGSRSQATVDGWGRYDDGKSERVHEWVQKTREVEGERSPTLASTPASGGLFCVPFLSSCVKSFGKLASSVSSGCPPSPGCKH